MERQELLDLIDRAASEKWSALDLSGLELTELPVEIGQLQRLIRLDISSNQIQEIPAAIGKLQSLTALDLRRNKIQEIPVAISQLQNLTRLYLGGNQIQEIPVAIGELQRLTSLGLSNNKIQEIPAAIGQLQSLTALYLRSNQIQEIPTAIGQLQSLIHLDISSNQIQEIPVAISQLQSLTELYLGENQIQEIPEEIGELQGLNILYLSSNQIQEIPEAISQLQSLTELYLGGNQIQEIPAAIGQLQNLTFLKLESNQIQEIPAAIGKLQSLTALNLRGNQISELEKIPDCLEKLPQLHTLDLRRNPLPILLELLGEEDGKPADLFDYLRRLRSGEASPLKEAKVLLIGEAEVGKTSVLQRLKNDCYNPQQSQTHGLEITHWEMAINNQNIKLHLWDFGGQDIYHATHQFFLTKRSLYILVINCRDSDDKNELAHWLKRITNFGGDSPIIIVGNKCDQQALDINRSNLKQKYPQIKAIIETSCETGAGFEELRQTIDREVARLREVYNLLPRSWFEVKRCLENMPEDFISAGRYATICAEQQITIEADQQRLLRLMHNLGLVINFHDHPILQSTNILNPHWVTEGIYTLIKNDDLKRETKGIVNSSHLGQLLNAQRYPADRHHCLIALMESFQLCFPLDQPAKPPFLIPGLLPKDEPADINIGSDPLCFQYHYEVSPTTIISRFIVLRHQEIHQSTYWRSGVVLAYQENGKTCNLACIKADLDDHKIFIAVGGNPTTRRNFLAIIRDTFTKIHRHLGPTEWVPVPGYPEADPLEYAELLGLEKMKKTTKDIGKLGITLDLRQLLDGYESIENRQQYRDNPEANARADQDMAEIPKARKTTMKTKQVLRIVIASPGDVQAERDILADRVIPELNKGVAKNLGIILELDRWEDSHPGFHPDGPQGLIDEILKIPDCDIFICLFWKRFGTTLQIGDIGKTGTEHEFADALKAWKAKGTPEIMMYFKEQPFLPTESDIEQWSKILSFKKKFPAEGLYWKFQNEADFERQVRQHLGIVLSKLVAKTN